MLHKPEIKQEAIANYQNNSYRFLPKNRLHTEQDAVRFVNERGFVFFWPINNIRFPSLWGAVAGDRNVPNNHDDPGHISWRWKDNLLNQRKWYYAKVLRRKSSIISLDMINNFFGLSETVNYFLEDIRYLHRIGNLSNEEYFIYSMLSEGGPLDTIEIKERLSNNSTCSIKKFDSAMALLQQRFHILPTNITNNGRWHYSYLYDTVHHYYPELVKTAKKVNKQKARNEILLAVFQSNGAVTLREINKILQWKKEDLEKAINDLVEINEIWSVQIENSNEEAYALVQFLN